MTHPCRLINKRFKKMKKTILLLSLLTASLFGFTQLNPAITSFLQNTTETGSYYVSGNPDTIDNDILVNCQQVEYSTDFVYVTATGIPSYATGPFQDGNPSQVENQSAIFKIPLNPEENTGASVSTNAGNIGIFINGVALFDFRDGVGWDSSTNSLCGGPGNSPCDGGPGAMSDWNRDAIPAEMEGFDCSKGHPAMGNYHHHQNPTAFDLDIDVVSSVCNLYDADGLYMINENQHSPLIGFAYDGYPIYGAYGYANADGTGGITSIKSSYQLRDITTRTEWADGTDVDDGPDVNPTYFLGYFREDYEYVSHNSQDYLDEHNGRICVTPEYPDSTYAYFATVDENWNSTYPYIVGPSFYGNAEDRLVTTISETTTVYDSSNSVFDIITNEPSIDIFPNPTSDLIAIQIGSLVQENVQVELFDLSGKLIDFTTILKGSTIAYFDVQTVYTGTYIVRVKGKGFNKSKEVVIKR